MIVDAVKIILFKCSNFRKYTKVLNFEAIALDYSLDESKLVDTAFLN